MTDFRLILLDHTTHVCRYILLESVSVCNESMSL